MIVVKYDKELKAIVIENQHSKLVISNKKIEEMIKERGHNKYDDFIELLRYFCYLFDSDKDKFDIYDEIISIYEKVRKE